MFPRVLVQPTPASLKIPAVLVYQIAIPSKFRYMPNFDWGNSKLVFGFLIVVQEKREIQSFKRVVKRGRYWHHSWEENEATSPSAAKSFACGIEKESFLKLCYR
jgi:hypothetical protein